MCVFGCVKVCVNVILPGVIKVELAHGEAARVEGEEQHGHVLQLLH